MAKRGVYQIRNSVSGLIYIGSTDNLRARWAAHRTQLRYGVHPAKRLLEDFWRQGLQAFTFEVLQELSVDEDLKAAEQRFIDQLRPFDPEIGYNSHPDAKGPSGTTRSASHRRKIALALTGQKFTDERRAAISRARKESDRAQAAIADLNRTKRQLTDDDVRNIVAMRKGGATVIAIAQSFGLTRRPIRAILAGETYSEVTGIPHPSQRKPKP